MRFSTVLSYPRKSRSFSIMLLYSALVALASGVSAGEIVARATDVATVDLSSNDGSPQHLAAGFIYGIPDNYPNQIPSSWYEGIDFQYGRAGGAQLGSPDRGWIWGLNEYHGRLASTKTNYQVCDHPSIWIPSKADSIQTCREFGAGFVLLPHDIWGTDSTPSYTRRGRDIDKHQTQTARRSGRVTMETGPTTTTSFPLSWMTLFRTTCLTVWSGISGTNLIFPFSGPVLCSSGSIFTSEPTS